MLPALVLAAALASPAPQSAPAPAARLGALRARYDVLWGEVNRPHILAPAVRNASIERVAVALRTLDALAADPDPEVTADLERRAELDERLVPALLNGTPPALDAAPGAHAGIAPAGDHDEAFAYWVPRGYDAHKPGPLVVLFHGATQPESDLIARAFVRELADRSGAVVLAPGGDDTDGEAMTRSLSAAERALEQHIAYDRRRRYLGGFSNGVFGAFHAVATQHEPCAGFLGISGVLLGSDVRGVGVHLGGRGAYMIAGANDEIIPAAVVRSVVRVLRAQGVFARYYEVAGAPHALRPLYPTIAKAWNDMLAGVTQIPNDGLGAITDRIF
ncbi:MAG TPA: hypothetical protein VGX96_20485 [Candidatus Elarobacter sp.]|nr:hypothetical protein [Candidatus Elarobacter sp.]